VFEMLREAARIAAWAPDEARELIAALPEEARDNDIAHARATELLARIGAITGEWALASAAYVAAAESWDVLDPVRAMALRAIGGCMPLAPFGSDIDALAHEIDLVRRIFDPEVPAPVVLRAVVELRRAISPTSITAMLERTFLLSPGELAYVMAVAAPNLEPGCAPRLGAADWKPLLGSSSLDGPVDVGRALSTGLVRSGLVRGGAGELTPHPALISRLLGRTTIEQPIGVTLRPVVPAHAPLETDVFAHALVVSGGIGVGDDVGSLAAVAARAGYAVMAAHPDVAATPAGLATAIVEAGLHGALVVIDLDSWPLERLPELVGPLLVTSKRDPRIPPERRAFTLSSPR
jgi:hypothetical protein